MSNTFSLKIMLFMR